MQELKRRVQRLLPPVREDEAEEIRAARRTLAAMKEALQAARRGQWVMAAQDDDRLYLAVL